MLHSLSMLAKPLNAFCKKNPTFYIFQDFIPGPIRDILLLNFYSMHCWFLYCDEITEKPESRAKVFISFFHREHSKINKQRSNFLSGHFFKMKFFWENRNQKWELDLKVVTMTVIALKFSAAGRTSWAKSKNQVFN